MDFGDLSATDPTMYNAYPAEILHAEDYQWLGAIQEHQQQMRRIGRRDFGPFSEPLRRLISQGLYNGRNSNYWSYPWQHIRQYAAVLSGRLLSLVEYTREQVSFPL